MDRKETKKIRIQIRDFHCLLGLVSFLLFWFFFLRPRFLKPKPRLFLRPNFPKPKWRPFFETRLSKIKTETFISKFSETETDNHKKLAKVSKPRSLKLKCQSLMLLPMGSLTVPIRYFFQHCSKSRKLWKLCQIYPEINVNVNFMPNLSQFYVTRPLRSLFIWTTTPPPPPLFDKCQNCRIGTRRLPFKAIISVGQRWCITEILKGYSEQTLIFRRCFFSCLLKIGEERCCTIEPISGVGWGGNMTRPGLCPDHCLTDFSASIVFTLGVVILSLFIGRDWC